MVPHTTGWFYDTAILRFLLGTEKSVTFDAGRLVAFQLLPSGEALPLMSHNCRFCLYPIFLLKHSINQKNRTTEIS